MLPRTITTARGARLDTSYLRRLLPALGRKAGLAKRLHPHALRHSFASDRVTKLPINLLQQSLGHTSLEITNRYVHLLGNDAVVNAMALLD